MFKQLVALDSERHRNLTFNSNQSYQFAREMSLIPVMAGELTRVAREMPIVFPLGSDIPQALVGYEGQHNEHVAETGHWMGRYIPAHIRRYPFILAEILVDTNDQSQTGRRYAMHVDIAAPHFSSESGEPLLDHEGQPTDILKRFQKILIALQQEHQRTVLIVQELVSLNLLVERSLTVQPPGGASKQLSGFRVISPKEFAKLSGAQLEKLRSNGVLELIYAHFTSLTNLQDGFLAKQLSQNREQAGFAVTGKSDDLFNFDNIDWSKFGRQ